MRLRHVLFFVLIGIFFGGGGWWWYQQRNQNSQVQSISLDESLAPAQSAESIATDSQDEALIARVIELPGVGLEKLPVEHFQPLFLRSACYLSAVDTCLVSIYEHETANRHIVRQGQQPQSKFLDKPEMAFSMGRILGESDKVREFFVKEYGTLEAYFAFVRFVRTVSLENHINPALVYSLYDYLLLTAQGSGQSLTTLPNPQQLTDQVNTSLSAYKRGEEPGDTISRQFAALEAWSAEDKALAAGLARSLSNPELFSLLFKEPGGFDLHYNDRIQGVFDNKPFEASFSGPQVPEKDYQQGQHAPGTIAACRSNQAALCNLAGPDSNGLWQLDCRWAAFLDEFCDGSLPVL